MGLNVSTTMGFENKDFLRNAAKEILQKGGASKEGVSRIIDSSLFDANQTAVNSQLSIIKAATQISLNSSLNETLKYLKAHHNKKTAKTPVFGEIWKLYSTNNEESEQEQYRGELYDFQINYDEDNIFAA